MAANLPTWAWWTERLTLGSVAVDAAAVAAGAGGVAGTHGTVVVVGCVGALVMVAVLVTTIPIRDRLRATGTPSRTPLPVLRLMGNLLRGGPLEPAEQLVVRRAAWSALIRTIITGWTETLVADEAAATFFDGDGAFRWPQGWQAVLTAGLALAAVCVVATARDSAQWRRIAVHPGLAQAPTAV